LKQRLSVVTLGVSDPERSTAFYESLGWQRIAENSGETAPRIFRLCAGLLLALYDWTLLAEDATLPEGCPEPFRGVTLAQCVESPAAVDAAMTTATEAGATIQKPAAPAFWGGYGGYFADPDGHVWEIAYNPWWFDADGNVIAGQTPDTTRPLE